MYRKSVSDFCPKHSKCTEYLQKILEKYWICTQSIPKAWSFNPKTFAKYFILAQIIQKILNFYPKHPKSFWFRLISSKIIDFVCKTLEIYRIFTQTLKNILFLSKTCQKVLYVYPNTWKVSYLNSWPKTFRTLAVRLQNSMRKVRCFDPNCSKQTSTCRKF